MAITDDLCRSFLDLWWHFDPAAATAAGPSSNDGRLGSFDPDSVREHVAALRSIAGAVEDQDIAAVSDEIDRTALLDHLRVLMFRLEYEHPWRRNPALWMEHACVAFDGLLARPAADPVTAAAALDRLRDLPRFLTDARDTLRNPPLLLVETALPLLAGLSALIAETAERFGPAWAVLEEDGAPAALSDAEAAVHGTGQALRSEIVPNPEPGAEAIGEEEVDRRLHHEHASVHNGAEVWRAANRLATETEAEVTALAAALDPSRPWRDLYQGAREEEPAGEPLAAWREAIGAAADAAGAAGFHVEHLPPLGLVEAPDYTRVLEPEVSYCQPGPAPTASLRIGSADPMAIGWLAVRHAVPGLHLHRARAGALPGLVRRQVAASSTAAGWALYAEELMRETDFLGDPLSRLVQRIRALRDAHLAVADLGVHTRQFTSAEAIGYLTARIPMDRDEALAEVRRIACRPIASAAAMLGRQELIRLRADTRAARGAGFSPSEFHESVLGYGGLPVPLIRWGMGLDD